MRPSGTMKKWSSKIEAHLLKKILPEFKKQFPRYHLGSAALKRVWNKVSYYYKKMQLYRGALHKNGKLNLPLMIRENLRANPDTLSSLNLPPYHLAHQIATKIGECMATLEGRCPDLDRLAKVIWTVQKNRVCHLSPMEAKNPYEEYGKMDKLIVKTLLETCSQYPEIGLEALRRKIVQEIYRFGALRSLLEKNELSSTISILLADKLSPFYASSSSLTEKKQATLSAFIDTQIDHFYQNRKLSADIRYQEVVQRILAFYPVAIAVKKNVPDATLCKEIQEIFSGKMPHMDPSLYIFIRAQMDLSTQNAPHGDLEKLKKQIVETYHIACSLPALYQFSLQSFELLVWGKLGKQKKLLAHLPKQTLFLIEKELGNIVLDKPEQTFRSIVNRTTQFFKNVMRILPFQDQGDTSFWPILEKKSEIWALQNEMLCRWVHFDDHTPLFAFFEKEWTDRFSIENAFERVLKRFPILTLFKKQLSTRLWVLQQYFWYVKLSDGSKSPYARFLKKYYRIFKTAHPDYSHQDVLKKLRALSSKMLPLTPFDADAL